MYVVMGYALGMLFGGSFLFTLYYLITWNTIVGLAVIGLVIGVAAFLIMDPDNFEEVVEVEPLRQRETKAITPLAYEYEPS